MGGVVSLPSINVFVYFQNNTYVQIKENPHTANLSWVSFFHFFTQVSKLRKSNDLEWVWELWTHMCYSADARLERVVAEVNCAPPYSFSINYCKREAELMPLYLFRG